MLATIRRLTEVVSQEMRPPVLMSRYGLSEIAGVT
jgi:hypothetical protein